MNISQPVRIIAHRGASAIEPENTMRAFRTAFDHGADMIEIDVRLSADGHAVVHHDARVGEPPQPVSSLDCDTLTDLPTEAPIPTLMEVLTWAQDKIGVYLDLKAPGAGVAAMRPLGDLVMEREVIVGSFHPELLAEVRSVAPETATSLLVGPPPSEGAIADAVDLGASYVHPRWEWAHPTPHVLLDDEFRATAQMSGLGIITWQEDRPDELRALLELGVDGICTNMPDRLVALRG